jgi:leucyl aminopeptidase
VFVGHAGRPEEADVDLLFVPVFEEDTAAGELADVDRATGGEFRHALESREFRHALYAMVIGRVTAPDWRVRRVAFVGAGARADADPQRLRRLAAACSHAARERAARTAGWLLRAGADAVVWAQAAADGLSAAEFAAGAYKHERDLPPGPARVAVIAPGADRRLLEAAVRRGRIVGEAVNFARALANEPGNVLTPREFAARVTAALTEVGLAVEVLDERALEKLGMRLLLGVARGSAEPPRVIVIRYDPPGAPETPVLALVGKGVTFDSGGLSIKPADGMDRMKDDMAGGAAVAAAMRAIALLGGGRRVVGIIPATENMPGGRATRPGDVIAGASGTTVEIINTDAEGRLILADALWYAGQLGATHLVDVATLTGACVVALGRWVSGLFGAPGAWVETVRRAADRAGDRVWPMPIYEEAREELRSEIADLVNSAGRQGGAITGAAFLREFAAGRPWAHLDIAGTAWVEERKPYQPKGATGAAVRLLTELATSEAPWDRGRTD